MTNQANVPWWTVARSEEVTGKKPLSVDIGDQPIVMWRDKDGVVRALEDRCPHRRAPLSRGCIRDNGWIQCGYHGWSYDGATGRLTDIPNMKDDQRFPPLYKAERFAVAEGGGLVWVCLDPAAVPPAPNGAVLPLSGTAHVALDQAHYMAALYDDPGLLLDIRGVHFTPYLMSELHEEDGKLVMERSCQWKYLRWPAPFSADFPITALTRSDPVTGETGLTLRDTEFNELLSAIIAPVPAARGVTAIRWRCRIGATRPGFHAKLLGFGAPFRIRQTIDAAALRTLKPSASRHGEDLRAAAAA
jgi:nitrite reductase/ring-hydroxylating ferredoxin subunit